jgi:hypothetical protein
VKNSFSLQQVADAQSIIYFSLTAVDNNRNMLIQVELSFPAFYVVSYNMVRQQASELKP